MNNVTPIVSVYYAIGLFVCFGHPKLLRPVLRDLITLELGAAGILFKPLLRLVMASIYCTLWPIRWFNAGKSEKKAKAKLDAELESFRPFSFLHSATNAPISYAGGDGSSFEQAVVVVNATLLSGPGAAYRYITTRYPGYRRRRQRLIEQNGRKYDLLEFTTEDGEQKTMYFDVTKQLKVTRQKEKSRRRRSAPRNSEQSGCSQAPDTRGSWD
jgi:hypothetical protein